ncbi:MAG: serine/threonine-protein phosphatase [Acidobacteria bacterium]|nr:MAG: serine/threonine-protein phosphatase [Acidobacteriota bacterium]
MSAAIPIRSTQESSTWTHANSGSPRSAGSTKIGGRSRMLEDQLAALRRENDDLRRTLFEAAHAQRKLCGPRNLRRGSFELASEIFPVRHLSGDFISIFDYEDDLVFAIGDIAGKGLFAAMWFSHLVTLIQLQFAKCGDPASTLAAMNRDLLQTNLEIPLSTLFLARLDAGSGEITYCNAGHPPSFLVRREGASEALSQGGPILGVVPGASFGNGKAAMLPGDSLIAYSDGAVECRNSFGAEFGRQGLLDTARNSCGSAAGTTLFSVLAAVENFTGSQAREDDVALIVLHRAVQ